MAFYPPAEGRDGTVARRARHPWRGAKSNTSAVGELQYMKDIFDFVSSLISSLAWPLVVLTVSVMMRRQIAELLGRIGSFKYKDLELSFSKNMEEVRKLSENKPKSKMKAAPVPEAKVSQASKSGDLRAELISIAELSPLAAIPFAWSKVETQLVDTVDRLGLEKPSKSSFSPSLYIDTLRRSEKLSENTYKQLTLLRQTRNEVVHVTTPSSVQIPISSAIDYVNAVLGIIDDLDEIES